jgi:hypothetical protein
MLKSHNLAFLKDHHPSGNYHSPRYQANAMRLLWVDIGGIFFNASYGPQTVICLKNVIPSFINNGIVFTL